MNRRDTVLALLALGAGSLAARAEQTEKIYRVGYLVTTTPIGEMAGADPVHPPTRGLLHELRALGYVEGRNLIFERRSGEGHPERFPGIVAELVRSKTDVIVLGGSSIVVLRAKEGAGNTPIVMLGVAQPMQLGFIASLARPGGNVTGLSYDVDPEIESKRLQLLKEAVPTITRVAYLATKDDWDQPIGRAIRGAAPSLAIELLYAEHVPSDLDGTLKALARMHPNAVIAAISGPAYAQRQQISEFAVKARLPVSFAFMEAAETGALITYGISLFDMARRAAHYVDKILRGANPGDLPIEQPTEIRLAVNLRTARAIGITIPQSILVRADRIIR
jgi:putative tryptophan/tyrosine transport system substrate-binding protein